MFNHYLLSKETTTSTVTTGTTTVGKESTAQPGVTTVQPITSQEIKTSTPYGLFTIYFINSYQFILQKSLQYNINFLISSL